jgi:hypothetical protein
VEARRASQLAALPEGDVVRDFGTRPLGKIATSENGSFGPTVTWLLGPLDPGSVGPRDHGTLEPLEPRNRGTVRPLNHTASSKWFGGGNSRRLSPQTCSLWKVETRTRAGSRFEVIFRSRTLHICRQLSPVEPRQPVCPIRMRYRLITKKAVPSTHKSATRTWPGRRKRRVFATNSPLVPSL